MLGGARGDSMAVLLPALVPVGMIIAIGFIVGRVLPLERQTLSQLVIYVLAPALIASSLYHSTLSANSTMGLVAGFAIATILLYLLAFALNHLLGIPQQIRSSLISTTLFANNGNLGLPFISFALGSAGLERAALYMIIAAVVMTSIGPALLQGGGIANGLKLTLKLPLLWATVVGVLLQGFAVELPLRLDVALEMLGNATIPVALVLLGMQLSQTQFSLGRYELLACGLRLLVAPAFAWIIGRVLGLEGIDLQVLVLQGAMPAAVNNLVWVAEFGGDANCVSRTILLSTLFSFITLPVVLLAVG